MTQGRIKETQTRVCVFVEKINLVTAIKSVMRLTYIRMEAFIKQDTSLDCLQKKHFSHEKSYTVQTVPTVLCAALAIFKTAKSKAKRQDFRFISL